MIITTRHLYLVLAGATFFVFAQFGPVSTLVRATPVHKALFDQDSTAKANAEFSKDFTKSVDEYEKVVNRMLYIQAKEKPDQTEMNEYGLLLPKAQELTLKLEAMKTGPVKAEDVTRLAQIQSKLQSPGK